MQNGRVVAFTVSEFWGGGRGVNLHPLTQIKVKRTTPLSRTIKGFAVFLPQKSIEIPIFFRIKKEKCEGKSNRMFDSQSIP